MDRRGTPLVICGNGPSRKRGLDRAETLDCDLWTVNNGEPGKTTLHWAIHSTAVSSGDQSPAPGMVKTVNQVLDELPASVPVMVQPPANTHAKNPVAWPMAEYRRFYGFDRGLLCRDNGEDIRDYLANSLGFMLAFAIMQGCYSTIYLYGAECNPQYRQEAEHEHPCIAFYLGHAQARGIKVIMAHESYILATGFQNWRGVYGLTPGPRMQPRLVQFGASAKMKADVPIGLQQREQGRPCVNESTEE